MTADLCMQCNREPYIGIMLDTGQTANESVNNPYQRDTKAQGYFELNANDSTAAHRQRYHIHHLS